jgi:hypothetical protein
MLRRLGRINSYQRAFLSIHQFSTGHRRNAVRKMSDQKQQQLVQAAAGMMSDDQTNAAERRAKGEFVRAASTTRNWIESGENLLYPLANNNGYHLLYVACNCPWCHRVLLGRAILGLQDAITVHVCFPNRSSDYLPAPTYSRY